MNFTKIAGVAMLFAASASLAGCAESVSDSSQEVENLTPSGTASAAPFYKVSIGRAPEASLIWTYHPTFTAPASRLNANGIKFHRNYTRFGDTIPVQPGKSIRFTNDAAFELKIEVTVIHFGGGQEPPCDAPATFDRRPTVTLAPGATLDAVVPSQFGDIVEVVIPRGQRSYEQSGTLVHDNAFDYVASKSDTALTGMGTCHGGPPGGASL